MRRCGTGTNGVSTNGVTANLIRIASNSNILVIIVIVIVIVIHVIVIVVIVIVIYEARKGTNGVSANGVTAMFTCLLQRDFWGTPVNLLLSSRKAGADLFPQSVNMNSLPVYYCLTLITHIWVYYQYITHYSFPQSVKIPPICQNELPLRRPH